MSLLVLSLGATIAIGVLHNAKYLRGIMFLIPLAAGIGPPPSALLKAQGHSQNP